MHSYKTQTSNLFLGEEYKMLHEVKIRNYSKYLLLV